MPCDEWCSKQDRSCQVHGLHPVDPGQVDHDTVVPWTGEPRSEVHKLGRHACADLLGSVLELQDALRMRAQAHELAGGGRQAAERGEEADDDGGVVAHVGEHAGAPARRLGRPQVPRKEGPDDQHHRHGGRQVLGVEVLQAGSSFQSSMPIWHADPAVHSVDNVLHWKGRLKRCVPLDFSAVLAASGGMAGMQLTRRNQRFMVQLRKPVETCLPHRKAPLRVQELGLMLDQVLELADDEAALLLHPAVEGHRLCISAQPRM